MSATIKIRRSIVPGSIPASLVAGELALNSSDADLYYLNSENSVVSLLDIDCGEIGSVPSSPIAVTGTAGDQQVSLTWLPPARDGEREVTAYVVQYSANNGGNWTTAE